MLNRRGLITGLVGIIAAPTIVRASSLMKVKSYVDGYYKIIGIDWPSPNGDYMGIMKTYWDEVQQKFIVEQVNAIDFIIDPYKLEGV